MTNFFTVLIFSGLLVCGYFLLPEEDPAIVASREDYGSFTEEEVIDTSKTIFMPR